MSEPVIIATEYGEFTFVRRGVGQIVLSGDAGNLSDLELRVRRQMPDFNLVLSPDPVHGYKASCKLTEASCALVFSEIFRMLTRP